MRLCSVGFGHNMSTLCSCYGTVRGMELCDCVLWTVVIP